MITKGECLRFYKRKDVQEALIGHAQNKEIGVRYGEGFGKRPDTLSYPKDILEFAFQGVTSFHASEELWSNPLSLSSELKKEELHALRTGWDLVLDIDCKIFEYSRTCADLIVRLLRYNGVKNISVKFSGNKGFHVGIPFTSFPKTVGSQLTKDLFPDAPKKIAFYVKESIKEELARRILEQEGNSLRKVLEKVNLEPDKITRWEKNEFGDQIAKLNVDNFLEIDTVLLASRHLYRMPYSLHEKSGLVSIPLDPEKVLYFEKIHASPNIAALPQFIFLERKDDGESARKLLVQALDFEVKLPLLTAPEPAEKNYDEFVISQAIPKEFFPPCFQQVLLGMEDGKKRALFCFLNFLGKVGWNKEDIELFVKEWNLKNREQLREVYIKGQMSNFKPGERLPPNCDNESYYKGLGLCHPDSLCHKIKNPANYSVLRWKSYLREKEEQTEQENKPKTPRARKTEEEKRFGKEARLAKKTGSAKL
jgi:DNA primase catalytic subunit